MTNTAERLKELFFSTLKLSACTFGGGFVIVPLMRKRFVEELHWIDEGEILDLVAVAQSSPGPIAVNASLMMGYRVAGLKGALAAAVGTVIPPLLIISIISLIYRSVRGNAMVSAAMRGMQAGVAAVICSVVIDMGGAVLKKGGLFAALTMAAVFAAVYFRLVNIAVVIVVCAVLGYLGGLVRKRRAGKDRA